MYTNGWGIDWKYFVYSQRVLLGNERVQSTLYGSIFLFVGNPFIRRLVTTIESMWEDIIFLEKYKNKKTTGWSSS